MRFLVHPKFRNPTEGHTPVVNEIVHLGRVLRTQRPPVVITRNYHPCTPLKVNMEHNRFGSDHVPFFSWVMAVGKPAFNLPGFFSTGFRGCDY